VVTGPKRKKGGSGGFVWRWLDAVEELSRVDEELTTAQRGAIRLVAEKRARVADPDGRNCWPSQTTLAEFACVTRDSVRFADGWLVRVDLMVMTRRAGRGVSRRYRLELPPALDDREDGHSSDGKMTVETVNQDQLDDRLDDRLVDRGDGHNRLPTTVREEEEEEEEEGASARSAVAPLAAPQTTMIEDLFSDGPVVVVDQAPHHDVGDPALEQQMKAMALVIGRAAGVSLEARQLVPALIAAQRRTGWSDYVLQTYCIEKLKRGAKRIVVPSAFLATDLGRIDGGTLPSPQMEYAGLIDEMDAFDLTYNAHGELPNSENPLYLFERELERAGLIDDPDADLPEPWTMTGGKLEQFDAVVRQVLGICRTRMRERDDSNERAT
jgi:hypothetical protein